MLGPNDASARTQKPLSAILLCSAQFSRLYANYSARAIAAQRKSVAAQHSAITGNDTLGALQIGVIAHKSAYTHLDARARGRRAKNANSEALVFPAKHRNLLFTISKPMLRSAAAKKKEITRGKCASSGMERDDRRFSLFVIAAHKHQLCVSLHLS